MNPLSITVSTVIVVLMLCVPRRIACLPLLMAVSYVTRGLDIDIASVHFTLLHVVVAVGFFRVMMRGESMAHGFNGIDRLLLLWTVALLATGMVRATDGFIYRAGMVWEGIGSYFLFRIFLTDADDVVRVFRIVCIILIPVAVLMILEKYLETNLFATLGGYSEVMLRKHHQVRARGPFAHPILAGTVGATCLGMAFGLWKRHRTSSVIGLAASAGIVGSATSSGPILMVLFILFGFFLYPFRAGLRALRWLAVIGTFVLNAVMNDPVYFLAARMDVVSGSTGWHRAEIIRSAFEHFNEWWLAGTDYTRHWMPTGTHANETQADITNEFLQNAVWGGLPVMILFVLTFVVAFRLIGLTLRDSNDCSGERRFLVWTLGALLFGHVVNMLSIALFDQSIVYLYLVLAAIGAVARYGARKAVTPEIANTTRGTTPARVTLLNP
jgi:hypothetical protein